MFLIFFRSESVSGQQKFFGGQNFRHGQLNHWRLLEHSKSPLDQGLFGKLASKFIKAEGRLSKFKKFGRKNMFAKKFRPMIPANFSSLSCAQAHVEMVPILLLGVELKAIKESFFCRCHELV